MRKIGLFASVHQADILAEAGWSENNNVELFDKFAPDIICGEVRKEDYNSKSNYQGPGEYKRYIFDYCKARNIRFVPCDWFDDQTISATQKGELSEANDEIIAQFDSIVEQYLTVGKNSCIPYNSHQFNALVKEKQELQNTANPQLHKIIWTDRNDNIIKNIYSTIVKNPDSNILIVFGAEHIYYIKDELEKLIGDIIIFPLENCKQKIDKVKE